MIGNLYTASLYLGFRSSLEFEYQKGINLDGKRIGFGSYGRGASAMVFSGVIQPEYKEVVKSMNLEAELGPRRKLTLNEYETIHENKLGPEESLLKTKHALNYQSLPDSAYTNESILKSFLR